MKPFTDEQKIEALERAIIGERQATGVRNEVLAAVAADLRAATAERVSGTLRSLQFQVDSARRSKARLGYMDVGHQQAMAEALLAHWPAVRAALKRFEEQGAEL